MAIIALYTNGPVKSSLVHAGTGTPFVIIYILDAQLRSSIRSVSYKVKMTFPLDQAHFVFNASTWLSIFEFEPVDRRGQVETEKKVIDREFWIEEWDVERVRVYLSSVYLS